VDGRSKRVSILYGVSPRKHLSIRSNYSIDMELAKELNSSEMSIRHFDSLIIGSL